MTATMEREHAEQMIDAAVNRAVADLHPEIAKAIAAGLRAQGDRPATEKGAPSIAFGTIDAAFTGYANVLLDGDSSVTPCTTLGAVVEADRVAVLFWPPSGALVLSAFGGGSSGGSVTAGTGLTLTGSVMSLTAPVTLALGGTNATTAAGALANLSAQASAGFSWNSQPLTNLADPTNLQDAATKNWVLNTIGTLDSKPAVSYCSTSALPANTYANGTSGVGATLTGNSNGPLVIDGVTMLTANVGERILVAGEGAAAHNGWYVLTQIGVVAVSPYILTRATESDQAAEIAPGYLTAVKAPSGVTGGGNDGNVYLSICAQPFTVGTTSLTFSQVGVGSTGILGSADNVVTGKTSLTAYGTSTTNAEWLLRSARGTSGSPVPVNAGDWLGKISFSGWGTSFVAGLAGIKALALENFGASNGATILHFSTTPLGGSVTPADIVTMDSYGQSILPTYTQSGAATGQLGTALNIANNATISYNAGGTSNGVPYGFGGPRSVVNLEGVTTYTVSANTLFGAPPAFQNIQVYESGVSGGYICPGQGYLNVPQVYASQNTLYAPALTVGGLPFNLPGDMNNWTVGFYDGPVHGLLGPGDLGSISNIQHNSFTSFGYYNIGTHVLRRLGYLYSGVDPLQTSTRTTTTSPYTDVTTWTMAGNQTVAVASSAIVSGAGLGNSTVAVGSNGTVVNSTNFSGTQSLSVASSSGFATNGIVIVVGGGSNKALLRYSGVGSGVLNNCRWISGSGTLATADNVFQCSKLAVRTSTGIATFACGVTFGSTLLHCIYLSGTGNVASGAIISTYGIVDTQVGLTIGDIQGDATTLLPLSGAQTNHAMQLAGDIVAYPSNCTFTSTPWSSGWIGVPATYTLDFANATVGSLIDFSPTILLNQSAGLITFSGYAMGATFSNVHGVTANLGSLEMFTAVPTYQSDGASISAGTNQDVRSVPTYTTVSPTTGDTLVATSHTSVLSSMRVNVGATVTTRYGLQYNDAVLGASQIVYGTGPFTRTLASGGYAGTIQTGIGSQFVQGSAANCFSAADVGAVITGPNITGAGGTITAINSLSHTNDTVTFVPASPITGDGSGQAASGFTLTQTAAHLVANGYPSPYTGSGYTIPSTTYTANITTQYGIYVAPLSAGVTSGGADYAASLSGLNIDGAGQIVSSPINFQYPTGPVINIQRNAAAALASGNVIASLLFKGTGDSSGTIQNGADIRAVAEGTWSSATPVSGARIEFLTTKLGVTNTTLNIVGGFNNAGLFYVGASAAAANFSVNASGNFGFNGQSPQALTGWSAPTATLSRSALANPGYTTTGATGATAGAFDTAPHRDAIITQVNVLTQKLAALETDLLANGVIG